MSLRFGIFGTFDVLNYGDLLFPIVAQRELEARLGEVRVIPYSYHAKAASEWPYAVKSLADLDNDWPALDGVIIGGGHIIRFDQGIAPGYLPADPQALAHPESYWLAPAAGALQKNLPVCWNAPSASAPFPEWAHRLLRDVLAKSGYVSVRDQASADDLKAVAPDALIEIVPDSVFGIERLLTNPGTAPLNGAGKKPYLVIQACAQVKEMFQQLKASGILERYDICFLPVCVCHGDDVSAILDEWPEASWVNLMPDVEAMARLIGGSAGVLASSLHLSITALAFGVPVLRDSLTDNGKYGFLKDSPRVFWTCEPDEGAFQSFVTALGTRSKCPLAQAADLKLKLHWDRIATALKKGGDSLRPFEAVNGQIFSFKRQEQELREVRDRLEESQQEQRRHLEEEERNRQQIASLETQLSRAKQSVAELKHAVQSAQDWQGSWFRRTFHRWRPPGSVDKPDKF